MKLKGVAGRAMAVGRFASAVFGLALIIGLTVGAASIALGANGGNFILGRSNVAGAITALTSDANGTAMRVQNVSPDFNDTALTLDVQEGESPLRVNSTGRVVNLNSDRLDGKNARALLRVASFNGLSDLEPGTSGNLATTTITAPAAGYLVLTGGSDFVNEQESDGPVCFIDVDDQSVDGSQRQVQVNGLQDSSSTPYNEQEDCSTNAVYPVAEGQHTVDLRVISVDSQATEWLDTSLSALYVPYGATGSAPSQAAIARAHGK